MAVCRVVLAGERDTVVPRMPLLCTTAGHQKQVVGAFVGLRHHYERALKASNLSVLCLSPCRAYEVCIYGSVKMM